MQPGKCAFSLDHGKGGAAVRTTLQVSGSSPICADEFWLVGIWERNLPFIHESPDTGICQGRHLLSPTFFLHCTQTGHVSWKSGVLGIK